MFKVGDRVGFVSQPDGKFVTGVVVKRTSGHGRNHVWLDRPLVWVDRTGGRRVKHSWQCVSMADSQLELTEKGPRFVSRPTFPVVLKRLWWTVGFGRIEVIDRADGSVVEVVDGAPAAMGCCKVHEYAARRAGSH
jgi:hypothetical protein